jgi:hypothetical protein
MEVAVKPQPASSRHDTLPEGVGETDRTRVGGHVSIEEKVVEL